MDVNTISIASPPRWRSGAQTTALRMLLRCSNAANRFRWSLLFPSPNAQKDNRKVVPVAHLDVVQLESRISWNGDENGGSDARPGRRFLERHAYQGKMDASHAEHVSKLNQCGVERRDQGQDCRCDEQSSGLLRVGAEAGSDRMVNGRVDAVAEACGIVTRSSQESISDAASRFLAQSVLVPLRIGREVFGGNPVAAVRRRFSSSAGQIEFREFEDDFRSSRDDQRTHGRDVAVGHRRSSRTRCVGRRRRTFDLAVWSVRKERTVPAASRVPSQVRSHLRSVPHVSLFSPDLRHSVDDRVVDRGSIEGAQPCVCRRDASILRRLVATVARRYVGIVAKSIRIGSRPRSVPVDDQVRPAWLIDFSLCFLWFVASRHVQRGRYVHNCFGSLDYGSKID